MKRLPILVATAGLFTIPARATTVFTNAEDTDFLNPNNWNGGIPDGTNGAGRINGDAVLGVSHDAGGSNIIVGYASSASLTVDTGVTLTTTGKFDVGRGSTSGTATINGDLAANGDINIINGSLTIGTLNMYGTTTVENLGTINVSNRIDLGANSGANLYLQPGATVGGGLGILQVRAGASLTYDIDAVGNHATIEGTSMQVRLATTDLIVNFATSPTIGSSYDLITGVEGFTNYLGNGSGYTFTNVTINGLDPGLGYQLDYNTDVADMGYLQLQIVPEPSAALLGGFGMLALLRRRR